jgi:cytoskeletal protein RodZ
MNRHRRSPRRAPWIAGGAAVLVAGGIGAGIWVLVTPDHEAPRPTPSDVTRPTSTRTPRPKPTATARPRQSAPPSNRPQPTPHQTATAPSSGPKPKPPATQLPVPKPSATAVPKPTPARRSKGVRSLRTISSQPGEEVMGAAAGVGTDRCLQAVLRPTPSTRPREEDRYTASPGMRFRRWREQRSQRSSCSPGLRHFRRPIAHRTACSTKARA